MKAAVAERGADLLAGGAKPDSENMLNRDSQNRQRACRDSQSNRA
jgi:hypothetical protein